MMKASLTLVLLLAAVACAVRKAKVPLQKSDEVAHPEAQAKQLGYGGECYGFFRNIGYLSYECQYDEYAYYSVQTGYRCCVQYYPPPYVCSGDCVGPYGYYGYLSFQCDQYDDKYYDRLTGCYCCVPQYRK